jgi:hypothetical protein
MTVPLGYGFLYCAGQPGTKPGITLRAVTLKARKIAIRHVTQYCLIDAQIASLSGDREIDRRKQCAFAAGNSCGVNRAAKRLAAPRR